MTPKTIAIHTHNARMTMDGTKAGLILLFGGSRVVNGLVGPIGAVESEVVNSGGQVKGDLNNQYHQTYLAENHFLHRVKKVDRELQVQHCLLLVLLLAILKH